LIYFHPFRLDPTDERLWRGNSPIELRPKAFQVLRYLVERPGLLVIGDELLHAVWPEPAAVPEMLTQVIAELRRTLGDDAHHPQYIQTVHRRGFRFIADVQPSGGDEAIAARTAPSPRQSTSPLVGREAELARLDELLLEARAGRRQFAFVTGEPGIGKTSLIRTFFERLANAESDEPVWIAVGKCVELRGERESYMPVFDALSYLARAAGAQPVARCYSRFAPSWLAQLPGLQGADEAKQNHDPTFATPARMPREFCLAVEALSEERTLVLWLEDVHWSDTATVDLLATLASRLDPARLLVLATYRPVDAAASSHPVAPLKRSLRQHDLCEELRLDPLDEASVRTYLSGQLVAEPDPALAALVHEQTEGNPLFVVTLVHYLLSERLIEPAEAGRRPSISMEALREAVPDSLGALVETQLDTLNADELELLQAASASGETFAAQVVAAATGRGVETVEKVCGRLAGWGRFIESTGAGCWPDNSVGERYAFLHTAFRHVIYRRLSAGLRRGLHRRIGERLEVGFADQLAAIASELALHFERGGDLERAVEYLVAAAAGVRQRYGDREAVAYFEHALALLDTLPESTDRDRRELELRVHLSREWNSSAAVSATEQDANHDRVLQLRERIGDSARGTTP
jgi:predicted ATPase/DNA-binding winged helix-turn-helix (wHTH) protein